MPGDSFLCCPMKWGTTGMYWVEANAVAEHLQYSGQAPTTKTYPAQNVSSAKAGTTCPSLFPQPLFSKHKHPPS